MGGICIESGGRAHGKARSCDDSVDVSRMPPFVFLFFLDIKEGRKGMIAHLCES